PVNNLSMKWKILLSVTLTCIAAVIVTATVTARSGVATTETAILEDSRTLARVLGEASIGAITFDDKMTVTASLEALRVSPRVLSAVIYQDGKPFAWYQKDSESSALAPELARPQAVGINQLPNGVTVISETIEADGSNIGSISFFLDLQEVDQIVADTVVDAIWLVIIISLVAVSLAYAVQLSIVRPVNDVVRALHDIAEGEGDLTRRLPVTGTDEISVLAQCFNRFVEQLHTIISSVSEISHQVNDSALTLSDLSQDNERE